MRFFAPLLAAGLAAAAPLRSSSSASTTGLSPAESSLSLRVAALSTYDWNSYTTNTSYNVFGVPVTTQTYVISTSFTPSYRTYGSRSIMVGQPVSTMTILLSSTDTASTATSASDAGSSPVSSSTSSQDNDPWDGPTGINGGHWLEASEKHTRPSATGRPSSAEQPSSVQQTSSTIESSSSSKSSSSTECPSPSGPSVVTVTTYESIVSTITGQGVTQVQTRVFTTTLTPNATTATSVVTVPTTVTSVQTSYKVTQEFKPTTLTKIVSTSVLVPTTATTVQTQYKVVEEIRPTTIVQDHTLVRTTEVVKPTTITKESVVPTTITRNNTAFATSSVLVSYTVTKSVTQTTVSDIVRPTTVTLQQTSYGVSTISVPTTIVSSVVVPTTLTLNQTQYSVSQVTVPTTVTNYQTFNIPTTIVTSVVIPTTLTLNQTQVSVSQVTIPTTVTNNQISSVVVPTTLTLNQTQYSVSQVTVPTTVTNNQVSSVVVPTTLTLNQTQVSVSQTTVLTTVTNYQISTVSRTRTNTLVKPVPTTSTTTVYEVATKVVPTTRVFTNTLLVNNTATETRTQTVVSDKSIVTTHTLLSTVTEIDFSISRTTRTKTRPIWTTTKETITVQKATTETDFVELPTTVLSVETLPTTATETQTATATQTAVVQIPTTIVRTRPVTLTQVVVQPVPTTVVEVDTEWVWQDQTLTETATTTEWNEALEFRTTTRYIHPESNHPTKTVTTTATPRFGPPAPPLPGRPQRPNPRPRPQPQWEQPDFTNDNGEEIVDIDGIPQPNFEDFAEKYGKYEQFKTCFERCLRSARNRGNVQKCQTSCYRQISMQARSAEKRDDDRDVGHDKVIRGPPLNIFYKVPKYNPKIVQKPYEKEVPIRQYVDLELQPIVKRQDTLPDYDGAVIKRDEMDEAEVNEPKEQEVDEHHDKIIRGISAPLRMFTKPWKTVTFPENYFSWFPAAYGEPGGGQTQKVPANFKMPGPIIKKDEAPEPKVNEPKSQDVKRQFVDYEGGAYEGGGPEKKMAKRQFDFGAVGKWVSGLGKSLSGFWQRGEEKRQFVDPKSRPGSWREGFFGGHDMDGFYGFASPGNGTSFQKKPAKKQFDFGYTGATLKGLRNSLLGLFPGGQENGKWPREARAADDEKRD